ncbi:MAG: putative solute-binding protein [Myxococcota bacterium]
MTRTKTLILAGLLVALALPLTAHAKDATLCVYDPSGARGDIFQMLQDYKAAASGWDVGFTLKPYTDEKTAADDFKAGQCDAVAMTGVRIRSLHRFAGTLEAMGAVPSYKVLERAIRTLAKPKASRLMESGKYEIAGIFPGGAVYLFVDDRSVDTAGELAGKRIATLAFDDAAKTMVRQVGASMVSADIGTFAGMFNNGSVDACYAPAAAYQALELYKGLKGGGGIVKYPLAQMTIQILVRSDDFPGDFAQKSREYAAKHFDQAVRVAKKFEGAIPDEHWIEIPDEDRTTYDEMFQEVRTDLAGSAGVYDKTMLKLLRGIRCKYAPTRAECAR